MLKLFKNKKAQNTAEYAILIALVVGGVIAMQTYAQRALQGRLRDASVTLRDQTSNLGSTLQYEPYYLNTSTSADKSSTTDESYASVNQAQVTVVGNDISTTGYNSTGNTGY